MKLFRSGNPKISYLIHPIMNKYIGRFQIPMYNIELMQIRKSFTNLKKHLKQLIHHIFLLPIHILFDLILRIRSRIIDKIGQIATITVFGDNIEKLLSLCYIGELFTLNASSYFTILGWINDFNIYIYLFIYF